MNGETIIGAAFDVAKIVDACALTVGVPALVSEGVLKLLPKNSKLGVKIAAALTSGIVSEMAFSKVVDWRMKDLEETKTMAKQVYRTVKPKIDAKRARKNAYKARKEQEREESYYDEYGYVYEEYAEY